MSQANNNAAADGNEPEEEKWDYTITSSEKGHMIYVHIHGAAKKVRNALRNAGGEWSAARQHYAFVAYERDTLMKILGSEAGSSLPNPHLMRKVNFHITFQCEDPIGTDDALQQIGLRKDKHGEWQGTLDQVAAFQKMFS